ncbi:MAG: helix-turn-helix domain-containing protein [Microthrixaceae bacterium]
MTPGGGDQHERAQVLRPGTAVDRIRIGRAEPPGALASAVDYLWWVEWNTPEPYVQDVVPRPVVHLAGEFHDGESRMLAHGVPTSRFQRKLTGLGRTVAVAFRPGGFRHFVSVDMADLTGRVVPVDRLVGTDDREVAAGLLDLTTTPEQAVALLSDWLMAIDHEPDPIADQIAGLVEHAEREPTVRRAEQLAGLAGVSLRTLQRRFRVYVGVSPKWVVRRYRILDVLDRVHGHHDVDWAALAGELGYADQSHLIRDFTALVGEPPARYRAGDRDAPSSATQPRCLAELSSGPGPGQAG